MLGDSDAAMEDTTVKNICTSYSTTSMINKPKRYKNPDRPSCIDLSSTNCPRSFQNSCVIETGLPDFHKIVVTVMKTTYRKLEPTIVHYHASTTLTSYSFVMIV